MEQTTIAIDLAKVGPPSRRMAASHADEERRLSRAWFRAYMAHQAARV